MKIIKRFSVPIFIVLVASLLVVIWFHEGFILGAAEAEIPFYRLESFEQKTSWAWTDSNLGSSSSLTIASGPTWWFLSQIQNIGVPGFIIQASVFWFLLVSAGMGIYWLTKILFSDLSKKYLILAVLFYFFNPLSLVNVWNRFLYNYMVFWALLPIALFLLIKGLKERKFILGIILALTLTFFSYALTAYVFNLLIWFTLVFTWLFFVFVNLERKFIFFSTKFFFLTFASFILLNSWWILPTFSYVTSAGTAKELSYFVTIEGNLYTLNILSRKLGNLIDIFRLIQFSFYLNEGPKWANFYLSPLLIILMFVIPGLILFGIYKLKKHKGVLFLGILFILGVFLAKGNNPPFGELFQFFFEKISFLQIFRNPFEKFGFILSLSAAPLFALGVREFSGIFNNRIRNAFYFLSLFFVLGVLGYPFFTGLVFTSQSPPNDDYSIGYKVKVPDYYKQADDWLQSQGNNFRFIGFPLGDEGMTYKWEKGYQGVEPGGILFSIPGITLNTSIPYYSQIAEKLEKLFFEEEDFYKVVNLLNVKYLLVRSDVDIRERRLRDPQAIENLLKKREGNKEVKWAAQFEKLKLWENTNWIDKTIYAANKPIFTSPGSKISDILLQNNDSYDILLSADIKKTLGNIDDLMIFYPQEKKVESDTQEIPSFEHIKKYQVEVDKQADYELILDEASTSAGVGMTIDNRRISEKSQLKNNRISYGLITLNPGTHEIMIERPKSENLIIAAETVTLSSIQNNDVSFGVRNFDPYARYFVEFDYLIKLGNYFSVFFNQSNDLIRNNRIVPQAQYFNMLTKGQNQNTFIHASGAYVAQRSEGASLLFLTDPNVPTEIVLRNISINRLIEPTPILIRRTTPFIYSSLPKITYKKHDPTKYLVHVEDASSAFILVLSELFNDGWEARFDDNTLVKNHFLANVYANGWLINKTGDFDLILEFVPQRLLNIGKIISKASILAGLLYVGSFLFMKKGI